MALESDRLVPVEAAATPIEEGKLPGIDKVRQVVRLFAVSTFLFGIYTLLSAGVCVVSSLLVIVQGCHWLSLSQDPETWALMVRSFHRGRADDCCFCNSSLWNLAVTGIVFGVLETLVCVSVGAGLGYAQATWQEGTSSPCRYDTYYDRCVYSSSISDYNKVGLWLLYASGHAAVAGPHNIMVSAVSLQLYRLLGNTYGGQI
jgi:hypothetical protein